MGFAFSSSKILRAVLAATILSCTVIAFADAHTVWSQRTFGAAGSNLDWSDSAILSNGRVVACGTEHSLKTDLVVQAWEPDGTVAWIYRYLDAGNQENQEAVKLATNGSEVFVVGMNEPTPTWTEKQFFVVKLNASNGLLLDESSFSVDSQGLNEMVCGAEINPAATSELFVTGYSGTAQNHSGWVMKLGSNLRAAWQQDLRYESTVTPGEPLPTSDGKVYVPSDGDSAGITYRSAVSKYSSTGVLESTYQVPNSSISTQSIAMASSGQIIFASKIGVGYQLSVLTPNLGLQGTRQVVDHFYDYVHLLWSDAEDALYVCSERYSEDLLDMRKFSSTGVQLWVDNPANKISHLGQYILKEDRFGNPVVVGNEELNDGSLNFVAWCWDASGYRQWKNAFTESQTSNDIAYSFAIDDSLRIFVVGKAVNPDPAAAQFKGAIWRTSQYLHRSPDTITERQGHVAAGSVDDLATADAISQTLCIQPGILGIFKPIVADYETKYPIEIDSQLVASLNVKLTLSCNVSSSFCGIALYDWISGTWRYMWSGYPSTSAQTFDIAIPNPARFVKSGQRLVRIRVLGTPLRNVSSQFCILLDQLELCSDI